MTRNQTKLLKLIKKHTELKWVFHSDRHETNAVALENSPSTCPYIAVDKAYLKPNSKEAMEFFDASDNKPGHNKKLRAAILAACGLTEGC